MRKHQQRLFYLICSLLAAWQPGAPANAQINREQRMQLSQIINKGNYLMARGQYQAAIDEYGQCFMVEPGNQVAKDNIVLCHNNWGISLFHQHKYEDAQAQWEEALKLNPYDRNAKNNLHVLKVTLDRMGGAPAAGEKNTDESKPQAAKKAAAKPAAAEKSEQAPPESTASGAVILGSGGNRSASGEAASASGAVILNPAGNQSMTGEAAAPSGAVILNPARNQSMTGEAAAPSGAVAAPLATSSDEFAGTSIKILPSGSSRPPASAPTPVATPPMPITNIQAPAPTSAPVTVYPPPIPVTTSGVSTLEDQLEGVEMKVYGHKQENLSVFQRLEKLEVDTSGAVKQGPVQERVQVLRHSYGL